MKLSCSTNAFTRFPVSEAVAMIAGIGYEGVELLADAPHLFAPAVGEEELASLGLLLADRSLAVANINANTAVGYYGRTFWEPLFEPSLANPDPAARRWRIAYTRRCIEMAATLGAPSISVTSGRLVPGLELDEALAQLRASLQELLEHAAGRGVRIGIEYEPGLLIESCDELESLFAQMASPFLGANLDLGHSHVLGEDVPAVIERLGERLVHLHLEDIRGRKHQHLIPGHGDLDFEAIFRALSRQRYDGFVTVELYTYPHKPMEATRTALEFLRALRPDDQDDR